MQMAENSKIEWCDHTCNLWWGCVEVHRGCDNCYARTLSHRWGKGLWGGKSPRERKVNAFSELGRMQARANMDGKKATVFVGSMMDIFEKSQPLLNPVNNVTTTGHLRDRLFSNIDSGYYPDLIFLFLTKRPSNINKMIPTSWKFVPPSNVWFGASVVDVKSLRQVSRHMFPVKGKTFYSCEPLLEAIDLAVVARMGRSMPDWVIVGGESGHGRRPFDEKWGRGLMFQCMEFEIPFFFKQIDKVRSIPEDCMVREFPLDFLKRQSLGQSY